MGCARPGARKYTYIAYERGGSELPIAVADTVEELAGLLGVSERTVRSICGGRCEIRQRLTFTIERILDVDDE